MGRALARGPAPARSRHRQPGGNSPATGSGPTNRQRRERRLVISIAIAAVALVLVTGGLIGSLTSQRIADPTSPRIGIPTTAPARSTPPTSSPGPSSSTEPGAATGQGDPVLSSLAPSRGVPGQSVVISGANLLSADGQIVAHFGGQVAATECPAASSCTVTVPTAPGLPASIPVTISTSSGTSNPLTFDYRPALAATTARTPCRRAHPAHRSACAAPTGPRSRSQPGDQH